MGEREPGAVADVSAHLAERRRQNEAGTCPETGRLPPEAPKTSANLDFDRPRGADRAATGRPPAMADPCARRSLASVGPEGVGKTHLARAYARGCRGRGMQSYHVKARELRDRPASPAGSGGGGCAAGTLARANCLAVDEIGRRASGRERAGPPLRVVDRRCEREGPNTTIPASNFGADRWGEFLAGGPTLLCTLDRIFDNATALVARGPSFRGAGLRTYAAGTAPVAAKTQPGIPQARQGGQRQGNRRFRRTGDSDLTGIGDSDLTGIGDSDLTGIGDSHLTLRRAKII
ncbi:ATP-binding protein [Olsenella sp. oral taxon 807]|uniref:ATP-binding protein n=1 Tax=Olsenella sp. oral taxon 807 TaxID=712411 RepID=UPI00067D65DE|nr:ATP-binding protein [Olsenella sp. oral taxon 807]